MLGSASGAKQASGTSEERPLDRADQWAAREGVVFTDHLIDRGKSGFHGKHRTEMVHAHLLTRFSLAHLGQLFPQTQESELGALQSKIDA